MVISVCRRSLGVRRVKDGLETGPAHVNSRAGVWAPGTKAAWGAGGRRGCPWAPGDPPELPAAPCTCALGPGLSCDWAPTRGPARVHGPSPHAASSHPRGQLLDLAQRENSWMGPVPLRGAGGEESSVGTRGRGWSGWKGGSPSKVILKVRHDSCKASGGGGGEGLQRGRRSRRAAHSSMALP